jgi:hypothetical protein
MQKGRTWQFHDTGEHDGDENNVQAELDTGIGFFVLHQDKTTTADKFDDTQAGCCNTEDCTESHIEDDAVTTNAAISNELSPPAKTVNSNGEILRDELCYICFKKFSVNEVVTAGCLHKQYYDCLQKWFVLASTNESLFPPQCCGNEFSIDHIEGLLSRAT